MLEKQLEDLQFDKKYFQEQLKTSLTLIEDMRQKTPQKPVEGGISFLGKFLGKK